MTQQAVRKNSFEIYTVDKYGTEKVLKTVKYLDDANRIRDNAAKRLGEKNLRVYFREVPIDHDKEREGWYFEG